MEKTFLILIGFIGLITLSAAITTYDPPHFKNLKIFKRIYLLLFRSFIFIYYLILNYHLDPNLTY